MTNNLMNELSSGGQSGGNRAERVPAVIGALMLSAVLFVASCSDNPADSENQNSAADFGGLTATDEAPAFGDPAFVSLAADLSGEQVSDQILVDDSGAAEMDRDPAIGRFALRVIWGKPHLDSTVTSATDWSGSLSVSRGGVVVRRKIRFEEGQDELLPRDDRQVIEWVSQTTVHNDGLLFEVFNPLHPDSIRIDTMVVPDTISGDSIVTIDTTVFRSPLELTFDTEPLTISFSVEQLAALDTVIYVSDSSVVIFQSTKIDGELCPRGYLAGGWGVNGSGEHVFRGVWMTYHGEVSGFVRGAWGVNDDGRQFFVGKWISESGRFEGFVRGAWSEFLEFHADDSSFAHASGGFRGGIFNADHLPIGMLRGLFWSSDQVEAGGDSDGALRGHFAGKWALACDFRPYLGDHGDVIFDDGDF